VPLVADHLNYYKVEKWTKAGLVDHMLLRRQQSRQGAPHIRIGGQAPAADQADDPAANARAGAVATAMKNPGRVL
jgi:hypothetical protein